MTFNYALAVYLSWGAVISILAFGINKFAHYWQEHRPVRMEHPGQELLWALLAAVILMALSVGLQSLLRGPRSDPRFGQFIYLVQIILIYSPIPLMMAWRRQGPGTIFLNLEKLPAKLIAGIVLSIIGSAVFLLIRGRIAEYPAFLATLGRGGPVAMVQTFLEGVILGYLLYRFGAWKGFRVAATVVAVLFMAGHLPNYMSESFGFSFGEAILFASMNAGITVLILLGVWKSQDIISFGIVHWFINAASSFTT